MYTSQLNQACMHNTAQSMLSIYKYEAEGAALVVFFWAGRVDGQLMNRLHPSCPCYN